MTPDPLFWPDMARFSVFVAATLALVIIVRRVPGDRASIGYSVAVCAVGAVGLAALCGVAAWVMSAWH